MAKPQLEDGRVEIATDLFAALFASGLPTNDMIVLAWVLLQSYGPLKKRSVFVDPRDVEDFTGMHPNNVRSSLKSLVTHGYLKVNEDGSYKFLKDWEQYSAPAVGKFTERLHGRLKRLALAALTRFGPVKKSVKSKPRAIQPDCETTVKGNPGGLQDKRKTQSRQIAENTDANSGGNGVSPDQDSTSGNIKVSGPILKNPIKSNTESTSSSSNTASREKAMAVVRDPDDDADLRKAVEILASKDSTRAFADELASKHRFPGFIVIEGWRWIVAARAVQSHGGPKNFGILVTHARTADKSDLKRALAPPQAATPPKYFQSDGIRKRSRGSSDVTGAKGSLP